MIEIQKASEQDIDAIVKIHELAFPSFFLTQLGSNFLRLYYKSVLAHQDGILLVCKKDGEPIGLCAGTILSAGFNLRIIRSNILYYCLESIKLLFYKPSSLLHLMRNMSKKDSSSGDNGDYAELLSIAVHPSAQGIGAGKTLLLELEEKIKEKGGERVSLTTDLEDNDNTIRFYKSLGYETWYDFRTYPNRRMWRMIKQL